MEAVQLFGGNGYMAEYRVEQLARDAKSLMIYAGSNEVQVTHIAKGLLRLRSVDGPATQIARAAGLPSSTVGLSAVAGFDRHRDHAGEFAPGQDP